MGERSTSGGLLAYPTMRSRSSSTSRAYHASSGSSSSNILTYPHEQKRSSRQIPLAYHSKRNEMSYNRTLSPGGRRLTNPARASDSFDPYYSQRHGAYASPRASTDRVIPISTQTYLNPPSITSASASTTRLNPGFDAYSGRPRRSSMLDNTRSGSTNPPPSRNRPTVVQADTRPSSPPRRDRPDFYIQPASSKETKPSRHFDHKKVYSVDEGSAKLVADVNLVPGGDNHHRQKDTGDRLGYKTSGYDRGRKPYHPTGKSSRTVDDDNAYSYTDPASMYKDTEPRWRETRPRRGSVDRGGASRERPVSMIEPYGADPRRSTREIGPPPSQRGWDKINDLGRSRSTRDPVPHSPSRGGRDRDESRGRYTDSRDPYYIAPRKSSADRSRTQAVHQDRPAERYDHDYDDRREPRHHERRLSATRHKDRSVSRRGFGVRSDSKDRYGTRGSNESFETRPRDSGFAPLDSQHPERDRSYAQDSKRKDHHRSYEDYDRDSDRDRARKDDSYRHHHRRDSERDDKKDGDNSLSGAAKIAAGGLGAAATLFGLNREKGKKEEREREEREEQERKREQARQRELERSREYDSRRDRESNAEPERRRRGGASSEEDPPVDRQRDAYPEADRGLGFAYEGSGGEVPKSRDVPRDVPRDAPREPVAPVAPVTTHDAPRPQPRHDNSMDRDVDRPYDTQPHAPAPQPATDADEDYRRRMEQVQRELGLSAQDLNSDSDPDRERRRREREIRQAERMGRKANGFHGDQSVPPGPPSGGLRASFEDDASQVPSQSTWSSAPTNNGQQELRRRASVLDSSMDAGLMAQVIDNSQSEKRENRVRIVDPPSDEEDKKPKGILKRPTSKFPEDPNAVREGVAPLKDANKKGIPPGARWTKIDRRLVNPEALEKSNERFEERQDFVIVLRVLTKDEIQKLADRTRDIRAEARAQEEKHERRASRRRDRNRDRKDRDEYEDENSEDEYAPRKPKMLEAPSSAGASQGGGAAEADFIRGDRERRDRERERESVYAPPPPSASNAASSNGRGGERDYDQW